MPSWKVTIKTLDKLTQICQRLCGLHHAQEDQEKKHHDPYEVFSVSTSYTLNNNQDMSNTLNTQMLDVPVHVCWRSQETSSGPRVQVKSSPCTCSIEEGGEGDMDHSGCLWNSEHAYHALTFMLEIGLKLLPWVWIMWPRNNQLLKRTLVLWNWLLRCGWFEQRQ